MYRFNVVLVIIFSIIFSSQEIFSQPNLNKAKERMNVAKKMRLLEILDLNESESEKFLAKYTILEKEINEKAENFHNANQDLVDYIENNQSGKELNDKTNAVLSAQENLNRAMENKFNGMRQVLNEQNFSKFVAFEIQFNRRMRKMLTDREMPEDMPPMDDDRMKRGYRKGMR